MCYGNLRRSLRWPVLALLPALDALTCSSKSSFTEPKDQRASCQCHGGPPGRKPRSLLASNDDHVMNALLIPDMADPQELRFMKEAVDMWSFRDRNWTDSGCPAGFTKPSELPKPVPGSYLFVLTSEAAILADMPQDMGSQVEGCALLRRCPYGYYCDQTEATWTAPKVCGKGFLCNDKGLSSPPTCPIGYFCATSLKKEDCQIGFYCGEGTYIPELCPKGYYCKNPCEQFPCPEGVWCPEGTDQPKYCHWWSRCDQKSAMPNFWKLGLVLALAVPPLFEGILAFGFRFPVHEQRVVSIGVTGMTLPCVLLLFTSVALAWLLMPSVALIQSSFLAYTAASVIFSRLNKGNLLRSFRVVLLVAGTCLVGVLAGSWAAAWTLYVPSSLFVSYLLGSPHQAKRRRGCVGLNLLCLCLAVLNGALLLRVVLQRPGWDAPRWMWWQASLLLFIHFPSLISMLIYLCCAHIQLHLEMPESLASVDRMPGISFQLQNVGLTVGSSQKPVLQDISLEIEGDSSCALMGPSGSGKSSLLNVLTGRALLYGDVTGRVFANGELIPEGIEARSKNATGFVPQDDVMHTNLTVYENVYFSARLRLPPTTEATELVEAVENVLKNVGIWHVKDTQVGNADLRGISGGQRKRASIAMELVGRPSVLFLDEPTSGLDASAAHSIIKLICNKAQLRCTSIAVIHQPRWQTLRCFDHVVLLATGGHLVYSGPVRNCVDYFTQVLHLKISQGDNPADLFLDFIGGDAARPAEDIAADWKSYIPVSSQYSDRPQPPLSSYEKSRPGVCETFWILYLRCSLQVCRLRTQRITNLCLVVLFLLLLRILLGEGGNFEDVLMQLGIAQSMLMLPVCIYCLHIFSCDRLERQREDIAGIPSLSQYMSKDFCHFVEMLLFATVWTGIYGPYSHLGVSPWDMLRVAVAQAYLAFGISFLLSINFTSQSTATVTVMLFLVVSQLCSGVDMISFGEMHRALGGVGWIIFIVSPSFYTVQRFLRILLDYSSTAPVRHAVCSGYLNQKGVKCDKNYNPTLLGDMLNDSYIMLESDLQLLMLGVAVRAIALFQLQLRAGGKENLGFVERLIRRLALLLLAIFLILTIPMTRNLSKWFQ